MRTNRYYKRRNQRGFIAAILPVIKGIGAVAGAVGAVKSAFSKPKSPSSYQSQSNPGGPDAVATAYEKLEHSKLIGENYANLFGSVEKNVARYFTNLNAEEFTAEGIAEQQAKFEKAKENIKANFAQRGLDYSGIQEGVLAQLEFENAVVKARISAGADDEVAKQQLGFLQLGERQKLVAVGTQQSAYDSLINAHLSGGVTKTTSISAPSSNIFDRIGAAAIGIQKEFGGEGPTGGNDPDGFGQSAAGGNNGGIGFGT